MPTVVVGGLWIGNTALAASPGAPVDGPPAGGLAVAPGEAFDLGAALHPALRVGLGNSTPVYYADVGLETTFLKAIQRVPGFEEGLLAKHIPSIFEVCLKRR